MPTIRIFGRSLTVIDYGDPTYRGGPHFEDIITSFDAEATVSRDTLFVLEDPKSGLGARFEGQFTYTDGEPSEYEIDKITFLYNGTKFQTWTSLGWTEAELEPVIDAFDDGNRSAVADFLDEQSHRFVLDRRAEDPGIFVLTEGKDKFVAEKAPSVLENGITIFSFGGDDTIDLRGRDETVGVNSGKGNDIVRLGDGFSQVRSGSGKDTIKGGDGIDNIDGQGGKDRIDGGGGDDDFLSGGNGNDIVRGGSGDDSINDSRGTNRLYGDDGDDFITGRGILGGGRGDDTISSTARGQTDTFDFRLRGDSDFGRDKIAGNWNADFGAVDRMVFDAGVEISHRVNNDKGSLLLTATQDGTEIGKVVLNVFIVDQSDLQAILNTIEFV